MNPNDINDRIVFILSGLSGAGKSQLAAQKRMVNADYGVKTTVISTNDYFRCPDGVWRFDPELLHKAHEAAYEEYLTALRSDDPIIVVDNTNIFFKHRQPYEDAAADTNYHYTNVVVGSFDEDFVEFCAARTVHDVDINYIRFTAHRYEKPLNKSVLYVDKRGCGWVPDWRRMK